MLYRSRNGPIHLLNIVIENDTLYLSSTESKLKKTILDEGYSTCTERILYLHYIRGVPVQLLANILKINLNKVLRTITDHARVIRESIERG